MFNDIKIGELENKINKLEKDITDIYTNLYLLQSKANRAEQSHQHCKYCGLIGHTVEMKSEQVFDDVYEYYHEKCYAGCFDVHLCECGCGKYISNKGKAK